MSDYYISNRTYFLSGSKIFVTDDDKSNGTEMTFNWFISQQDITITEVLEISNQTSGSKTYMTDREWF